MAACSRRRSPTASATRSASPPWRSATSSTTDHVNSIIAGGRADLCALARPHLADPHFTLHAAAALGFAGQDWPKPWLAGKEQLERQTAAGETEVAIAI